MSLVVLAPSAPNSNDGLHVSRWVAERVLLELRDKSIHRLLDSDATRERVLQASDAKPEGLLAFSHGGEGGLSSVEACQHRPLLTRDDLPRWSGRWIYAFACRSAEHLADAAVAAGVACFAGYLGPLFVEWEPEKLPEELARQVHTLVVLAALRIVDGERDVHRIKAELSPIADGIFDWIDLHLDPAADNSDPAGVRWIQLTAQQLVNNLVLALTEVPQRATG